MCVYVFVETEKEKLSCHFLVGSVKADFSPSSLSRNERVRQIAESLFSSSPNNGE